MILRVQFHCLAFLLLGTTLSAGPPVFVQDSVNFDEIILRGLQAFSDDQIRLALKLDLALIPKSQPGASLSALLKAVKSELSTTYQHLGFYDIDVNCIWDEATENIAVDIYEGKRYRWGELRISGVSDEFEQAIREKLQAGQGNNKPGSKPFWKSNDYVDFNETYRTEVRRRIGEVFQELAFDQPKLSIEVDAEPLAGIGHLIVTVNDLGPVMRADEIHVLGNKRQSREDILKLLQIQPETAWTATKLAEAQQRLWESGRFRKSSVELSSPLLPGDPRTLLVKVAESSTAPLLSDPLTEVQQIAVKCADWINHLNESGYDLNISYIGNEIQDECQSIEATCVFHPSDGIVLTVSGEDPIRGGRENVAFLLNREQGVLLFVESGLGIRASASSGKIASWNVLADGADDPLQGNRESSIQVAAKLSSETSDDALPGGPVMDGKLRASPMWALYTAHQLRLSTGTEIQNGILRMEGEGEVAEINTKSGRLLRYQSSGDNYRFSISFESGALQLTREELLANCRIISLDKPFTFAGFVEFCEGMINDRPWPDQREQHRWQALVSIGKRLAEATAKNDSPRKDKENTEEEFAIVATDPKLKSDVANLMRMMLLAPEFFPQSSLPATWSREMVYALVTNDSFMIKRAVEKLSTPQAGPLMHYFAAWVVHYFDPRIASQIAEEGLQRLDNQFLQTDLAVLLDAEGAVGEICAKWLDFMRDSPDEELHALIDGLIPPEDLKQLMSLIRDDSIPSREVVHQFAAKWWKLGGRTTIEKGLRSFRLLQPAEVAVDSGAGPND